MRSDTAFFSAAVISRRFLCGLTSGWLSAEAAVAFLREERRDAEPAAGAEAPRSCSTSVSALISAWRRSISLYRSAIACGMTLLMLESSGPAMGMSTNGVRGRRCGSHAPPPAAAGGGGEEPGAAGGRPGRAARAGGGGGGAAGRARRRTRAPARQACPTAKPAAAGPPAFSTVLRPARAAMTCRPRAWDGQRVAPVVPPAVEVVPVRHRRSRRCDERRVGGHGPDGGRG